MPASRALASSAVDVGEAMSLGDVADRLGISGGGARALADEGLLGREVGAGGFAPSLVDGLAERVWRAALPTASDEPGVRLRDAVEGADVGLWPSVISALLDGRLNAFRRRGAFGEPILAALVVSSVDIVADVASAPDDAPFIWTPTPKG